MPNAVRHQGASPTLNTRGGSFRRPLRWLSMLTPLLTFLFVLGAMLWQHEAIFSPGPLSPAHAMLSQDCKQCHSRPLNTLRLTDKRQAALLMNQDCLRCHGHTIGESETSHTATHHERVPGDSRPCATCHREHEGRALTPVAEEPCVRCHAELRTQQRDVDIAPRITTFAAGPGGPGPGQGLHPEFRWLAERRSDPGVLRFNHRHHLLGEHIAGPGGQPVVLQCYDCHRPTGVDLPWRFDDGRRSSAPFTASAVQRGELMAPIAYATHCAGCHRLTARDPEGSLRGTEQVARQEVPHTTPAAIRIYLRGQLAAAPRAPEATEQQVLAIERDLYQTDGQGCVKCHTLKPAGSDVAALPILVPTALPSRFLPRARFDHAKHSAAAQGVYAKTQAPDCLFCHAQVLESTRTSDVLIPGIDECRRCHAPESGYAASRRGGVTALCTTCHTYHVPPPSAHGPTPVPEGAPHGAPLPSLIAAGRREVRLGLRKATPLWPLSAFFALPAKVWGLPGLVPGSADYNRELFVRYGLFPADFPNDGLPLGLLKTERMFKGEPGLIVSCELCHSSSLLGQITIGQPNPFASMEQLWIDLGLASGERGTDPLYYKNPLSNTVVNGADHLGFMGLLWRKPDLSLDLPTSVQFATFRANQFAGDFDALAYIKTPPWYTYATRKTGAFGLYADGGQPKHGNFAAFTYLTTFRDLDGQDCATALAAWKQSGPVYLSSLSPPRYPFPIHNELLPSGRALYDTHCARCHGRYMTEIPSPDGLVYPGLVYPLEEIKTDPKRAHFPSFFAQRIREILKEEYIITGGYAATPLTAIWARAPYLHNGSVPTLAELLDPQTRRAKYQLSANPNDPTDFDQVRVGWRVEPLTEGDAGQRSRCRYDPTVIPGLGNSGHAYGSTLSQNEKLALLEFLKTL